MVRQRAMRKGPSAAERRLRALAPGATTAREAAAHVVSGLMEGFNCPPTDLDALARRIGVCEIAYESFPGSGELHKLKNGYRVVCSSDQPKSRQRFTIAHELAHVILERTGGHVPREGPEVERICDILATECLMPASVFRPKIPQNLTLREVSKLADTFQTSLRTTAIRCAEFRPICIFGVTDSRVTWAYGGIRSGDLMYLPDDVRDNVDAALAGELPAQRVYFSGDGVRGGFRQFDWLRLKNGTAMFLLTPAQQHVADAGTK